MKFYKSLPIILTLLILLITNGLAEQKLKKDNVKNVDPAQNQKATIEITNTTYASAIVKTKILVNQKLICEAGQGDQCKTVVDSGQHEITLDNPSWFGTYSEKYDLMADHTYRFEIVADWQNIIFFGEIFSSKGKDGQVKLELVSIEKIIK